jgi:hypothetical protein
VAIDKLTGVTRACFWGWWPILQRTTRAVRNQVKMEVHDAVVSLVAETEQVGSARIGMQAATKELELAKKRYVVMTAASREPVGANQKTLVVVEVHHDIRRFSQPALLMCTQPVQSFHGLILNGDYAAVFLSCAENT